MSIPDGDKFLILENNFWKAFLMTDQTYLGRCVVTLKRRDCGDLADLTSEELLDFHQAVKKLERAYRKAFGATMFNWACLMNLAYQRTPPDPHVHWHCRPRYDHAVSFAGLEFVDSNFGQHYKRSTNRDVGDEVKKLITEEIKKAVD